MNTKNSEFIFQRKLLCFLFIGLFTSSIGCGYVMADVNPVTVIHGVQQETIKVEGLIRDKNGEPIIGASVKILNQQLIATSDINGRFSASVPLHSTLEFTYIGFKAQKVQVKDTKQILIVLEEDSKLLDEVVVVGYDSQRRVNLSGAVGTVNVEKQLEGRPITDIGRGLQGATPGLSVTTTSGRIGTDPSLKIRGVVGSLINSASAPLVLLDNVEVSSISVVNPDDVESISILKDAASSSIYGTRAAFGVVLITTKKAKVGEKFSINYSNNFSWNKPTVIPEIVKSYEGAEMSMYAGMRANPNLTEQTNPAYLVWNWESIERMKEWERVYGGARLSPEMVLGRDFEIKDGKPYFYRSFDAPKDYIKNNSFSQQHNLSINGASGNTTYNISTGFLSQEGIIKVKTDEFKRYNVSFNTNSEVNKWVSVRTKLLYSRTELETPFSYTAAAYDAFYYLYRWPRIMPYGTYEGRPFRNAVTETQQANMNSKINNYTRISLGTTIKVTSDFSIDADYTLTLTNRMTTTRGGEADGWNFWGGNGMVDNVWTPSSLNKIEKNAEQSDFHTGNIIARWQKNIKKDHDIKAFAGSNIEYYTNNSVSGEIRDLIDFDMPEFNLATGDQFVSGGHGQWAALGFFARINYMYKNRYLLELNGRYDGSSRFPLDQRWGFFPSMSAGYILTEENFMTPLKPWLSFAKLRVSWGSVGNQNVGEHRFLPIMASASSNWIIDNTAEKTLGLPRAIAKGFTWETITTTNFGIDTRFFDDKFGVSFDVYKRVNSDMITSSAAFPSTYGATAPYMNFGELTTEGWELALDFRHKFSNGLRLNATATLSDAMAKITKYPLASKVLDGRNYEGRKIGEIWGFVTDRFFTEDDFDTAPNGKLVPKADIPSQSYFETNGWFYYGPGDIKYKDLDGSKEINRGKNTADDPGDQKIIGNTTPRYEFGGRIGLEYKGIDFDLFLQGVGKRELWSSGSIFIPGFNYMEAWYTHQLDYWTPENPNAFYPRLSNLGQSNNAQNFLQQSKYLLDMSYCRIKNITLGYSLPTSVLKKIQLKKLRVYVSLENLFEFDNLGKIPIDPETGVTTGDGGYIGRSYPYSRTASFGLQASF